MDSKGRNERNYIATLLLSRYNQWRGSSFLGYYFRVVLRGSKLYIIVLFSVVPAYAVRCCLFLACGRQSLLPLLYIILVC